MKTFRAADPKCIFLTSVRKCLVRHFTRRCPSQAVLTSSWFKLITKLRAMLQTHSRIFEARVNSIEQSHTTLDLIRVRAGNLFGTILILNTYLSQHTSTEILHTCTQWTEADLELLRLWRTG